MTKIDGEEIDRIKICDYINFIFEKSIRSSTYNFNDESKWIEFIIILYKPLTKNTLTIISSYLNVQMYELQKKGCSHFFKNKETKWRDELWKPVYTYRFMSYKTISEEPTYPPLRELPKAQRLIFKPTFGERVALKPIPKNKD